MFRNLKGALLALIVLGVAGLGYLFFAPQPVAVDLASVDRGRLEVTVDEEGETQVKEIYRISAPITGKLERVDIQVGDRVLAGQRIARVRPVDPPIRDLRSRLPALPSSLPKLRSNRLSQISSSHEAIIRARIYWRKKA